MQKLLLQDLVTICFTSGTTGLPKGAMLTHGAMIADVAGAIVKGVTLTEEDVHVSYLPLAHIFERLMQVRAAPQIWGGGWGAGGGAGVDVR